jgi:hypothetical protein
VPQHGQCQQTPDRQGVAACGGRPLGPLYLMLDAWYMRGLLTHAVLRLTDRLCSASSRTHALTGSEISKRSAWYWQPIRNPGQLDVPDCLGKPLRHQSCGISGCSSIGRP